MASSGVNLCVGSMTRHFSMKSMMTGETILSLLKQDWIGSEPGTAYFLKVLNFDRIKV